MDDYNLEQESQAFVNDIVQSIPATEHLQQIKESQQQDTACEQVTQYCQQIKQLSDEKFSLFIQYQLNFLLKMVGCRSVIPTELQSENT